MLLLLSSLHQLLVQLTQQLHDAIISPACSGTSPSPCSQCRKWSVLKDFTCLFKLVSLGPAVLQLVLMLKLNLCSVLVVGFLRRGPARHKSKHGWTKLNMHKVSCFTCIFISYAAPTSSAPSMPTAPNLWPVSHVFYLSMHADFGSINRIVLTKENVKVRQWNWSSPIDLAWEIVHNVANFQI